MIKFKIISFEIDVAVERSSLDNLIASLRMLDVTLTADLERCANDIKRFGLPVTTSRIKKMIEESKEGLIGWLERLKRLNIPQPSIARQSVSYQPNSPFDDSSPLLVVADRIILTSLKKKYDRFNNESLKLLSYVLINSYRQKKYFIKNNWG
ncbi:hypothetical protein A2230_00515 [candidate division WOR-1 bacterium RIFOXYA2_FULL_36_21]|uniref:Uncharacterized protein n=1 Tax=candidate division WOR-1 bacterium RIFOXYB2_FULL_36_35 TaxID=1802578 RepID=A0A1F4S5E5_UNCSA|nr:MAG: hypothetical protein A2230_00515 [candidate division WOR-1 bacterium RIFOXYA2_FULL_36_21]OGC15651.1 MAG: hypothetical protein A2290_06215 [candidate division WOR-1 bacterium RIFOXYB2_FULL_36_35]OGC16398.1 MAG: hypothetical protein A2282_00560 [candidate division WOR-1 bacterium RIFOXYA12_FULL_36_13]